MNDFCTYFLDHLHIDLCAPNVVFYWGRSENFRRSNNISTFFNFFKSWEAAAIQKFKSSKVEIHDLQKVQKLKNYKYNIWKRSKVQKVQMVEFQHWKSWKSWKSSKVDFLFPEKFKSSKVEIWSSEKLKKLKNWMSKWLGEGECVACCATAFFADGCGWRLRGGPLRGRPETFNRSRGATSNRPDRRDLVAISN